MHNESMIFGAGASLAVISLFTFPAVSGLVRQVLRRQPRDDALYSDADGTASAETVASFSAKLPKSVVLLSSLLGLGSSLSVSLIALVKNEEGRGFFVENWLTTAAWVLLLLQTISIASIHESVKSYRYGLLTFVCSFIQAYVVLTIDAELIPMLLDNPVTLGLRIAEAVAVVVLAAFSILLPRRPDVFYNGEPVDQMHSVTAYSRFTFSWPTELMNLSLRKKTLELSDMPRPNHETRTVDVSNDWKTKKYSAERLWLSIVRAHGVAFALQWIMTLCTAVLGFAPQWVVLHLLRILEARVPGQILGANVWIWVLWLGIAIIAQSLIEAYVFWVSWADLAIPIRSQLSALIFEKAMRRKDVKQSGKTAKEGEGEGEGEENPLSPKDNEDDDELESAKKTKQGTVNLIGVDCKRVSDFCSFQNLFPSSLFKLAISLAFLIDLLGWKALLAGFTSMGIIMPFNIYFSKLYSQSQDRLMKLRDEKLEVVTEALQGIRQIKFSALEPQWEAKIREVRDRELKSVWNVFCYDAILISCWVTSPIALSAISLAVYAYIYGELTPSVAFVSLGVFRALEVTLSVVPELTTDLLDAWVSVKRIQDYLLSPDLVKLSSDGDEISFDKASLAWPTDDPAMEEGDRFVLRDVSLTFPKGELSIISGKTGTGKSLMLASILGEIDLLAGSITVPRAGSIADRHDAKATRDNWILPKSIAYIAQIPWIENATIRENITFGLPFDEERYRKTLDYCALTKDLDMLSDGENTEIGANGINLSGGQKWRITLARAIYSRAGILVMDDIFSAVDAHVGRHIFEKCITGELCAGRTRILVTHHVALCAPKTKYLVELGDGHVLHAGLVAELAEGGILEQIKSNEQSAVEIIEDETADATAVNSDNSTDNGDDNDDEHENGSSSAGGAALKKVASRASQAAPAEAPKKARKFVEDEKREEGAVRKHVYFAYLKASGGYPFWLSVLVLFTVVQVINVGRSWWLRIWTSNSHAATVDAYSYSSSALRQHALSTAHEYSYNVDIHQQTSMHAIALNASAQQSDFTARTYTSESMQYYMGIYVLLALLSAAIGSFRYYYLYLGSIHASRTLFDKLNFNILRAPLRWLDTVPLGRILNRFTADFNIIDTQMANSIGFGGNSFIQLFGVVLSGLMVSPYIVLMSLILLAICTHFGIVYVTAARPAKRLESTAKSPVFEQFGTALSGVATIRGYDKSQVYIERMYRKLDDWAVTTWHLMLFNRWVGWRMSLVGSFFSVIVASIILSSPTMDSALAGFALAFALDFASCVMWTVRLYANVELQMNAAERIIEYTELSTEDLGGESPPAAWPTEGRIEFDNLVVSYAPDLPPVLKGLTFSVDRNQRVGVVGRTGAGKSSLTLALFRFLEAQSGSIYIDGVDISKIKLHDLRSRLAIIPQDPVLFSGTIRSNLDPFDTQTDAALKDCLERVHLTTSRVSSAAASGRNSPDHAADAVADDADIKNTNIFNDLSSHVSEGGLNLSQGQRQLLCLARAIVRRPRVMVLDEATSAVDMHTDTLIQRSIREEFTDSTLLVIAHRLSTIADFDRILVLSDGKVAEYGTPRELWEKGPAEGVFRGMCEESGEREKLERVVFASA